MATLLRTGQIANAREVLTANRTYYVRTDGSDSNDGLTDSAGGAFLTGGKATTTIKSLDLAGYVVTIQFGTGTFSEIVRVSNVVGGNVNVIGTLTTLESVTSATVAAGTGATQGTVTKTGQFTGDSYANKLVYFETDGAYRLIDSHTNDVLTLVGTAPSSTTQNVTIYDWGTIISRIDMEANGSVRRIKCTSSGGFSLIMFPTSAAIYAYEMWLNGATVGDLLCQPRSGVVTVNTFIDADGSYGTYQPSVSSLNFQYSKILGTGSNSLVFADGQSYFACSSGSIFDNGYHGILVRSSSAITSNTASVGYNRIRNNTYGITAINAGQGIGTANNQYSGNTTNENGDATSFGYID